jgi:hypothetical protein
MEKERTEKLHGQIVSDYFFTFSTQMRWTNILYRNTFTNCASSTPVVGGRLLPS